LRANAQLLPQPHWPSSSEERLGTFILHCGTERLVAEALGGRVFRRCSVRFMLRLPPLQASWATNLDAYRAGLPRPVHPGFRLVSHLLEAPNNATGASWATPRVGLSPTGCMMLQAATSLHPRYRASSLLRGGPSLRLASVLCLSQFLLLEILPLGRCRVHHPSAPVSRSQVRTFHARA